MNDGSSSKDDWPVHFDKLADNVECRLQVESRLRGQIRDLTFTPSAEYMRKKGRPVSRSALRRSALGPDDQYLTFSVTP
jgi:hypothetical protein